KVSGTRATVEPGAEFIHGDPSNRACGVHFCHARSEEQVHAFALQHLAVALEQSRIFRQVFVGAELGWVDEDRSGYRVARCPGGPHQRKMALMQRSHGGNESEAA